MERAVVVGGLMICGSFLLAASLNRSAVKETPLDEPAAAEAPVAPADPAMRVDEPTSTSCTTDSKGSSEPVMGDAPARDDLPGNGRETCSQ